MRKGLLTLVAVAGVLALAASPAAQAKKPSGSTINLMTIGAINAPGFSLPQIPVGAQVAVNQLNKAGGLNGHPVKLIVCNDENNPNTATGCARQAIQDKVVAVVGGLSIYDTKIDPYLKQAGIPWIGSFTPDDYTSNNLFVYGDAGLASYVGIGEVLAQQGCKKVGIVLSAESVPAYTGDITAGVNAGGAQVVGSWTAPASNPDWSTIVTAARAAGAQCIASGTGPTETGGLMNAVAAGSPLKVALLTGGLPTSLIKQLGSAANGMLSVSAFWPQTTSKGLVPSLVKAARALSPKTTFDAFVESGYASVQIVEQAAKGLKSVTSATLLKSLPKIKGFDTQLGPVVNFSKPVGVKGFSRLFGSKRFVLTVANGNFQLKQPKPIDIVGGLKLLAASGQ